MASILAVALIAILVVPSCKEAPLDRPRQREFHSVEQGPLLVGTPGTWDAEGVEYPVVYAEGGTYYLYYSAPDATGQRFRVGLATAPSPLGPWTKFGDGPILAPTPYHPFDAEGIVANYVMRARDVLLLFFSARGYESGEWGWHIGVALSPSPKGRFTKSARGAILGWGGAGEFDSRGQDSASIVDLGGVVYLWFRGWNDSKEPQRARVGLATAMASDVWTIYGKDFIPPVISPGGKGSWDSAALGRPTVVSYDGSYHLWYEAYGDQEERRGRIGYAVSTDGVVWRKAERPILEPGPIGSWDQDSVAQPFAFVENDTVYLYYVGTRYEGGRPVRAIGVAVGPTSWLGGSR